MKLPENSISTAKLLFIEIMVVRLKYSEFSKVLHKLKALYKQHFLIDFLFFNFFNDTIIIFISVIQQNEYLQMFEW